MTLRTVSIFILTIILFASCSLGQKQRPISRVSYFSYGGYGDTLYSTLEGQIFSLDTSVKKRDSLKALQGVSIQVVEYNKSYITDSNGQFIINLDKGVFSLLVSKQGFQPLLIKNYVSDPDQISGTKIYLERGNKQQTFEIPKGGIPQ